ncbi:MAG: ComF family protein [Candidatus Moraniibacteriota bacterium]|jgi:ComF family protein
MSKIKSPLNNLKAFLNGIQKIILDGLFPIRCLGCGVFDEWICTNCHSTLPILTEQHCPICKKHETKNGQVCPKCLLSSNNSIAGVFIASHYSDKLLKKSIHYYKYRFVYALSEPLALLLAQSLQNSSLPSPDIIIPIPLHKRRLRWRGFNQAELLAINLDLQIPINTDILLRVKYTAPQVKVKNKNKRQENLANAFIISDTSKIINKNILLIDDVITTGTTLKECAMVLKKAGADKVFCLVLARE